MSISIMSEIFKSDLEPRERLIALAIADNANEKGVAWPSYDLLMNKTGIGSRSTISAGIKKLKQLDWMSVTNHSIFGEGKKVNVYTISPPAVLIDENHQKSSLTKSPPAVLPKVHFQDTKSTAGGHESSLEPPRKKTTINKYKPDWISDELWKELIANRKFKKLQNTKLALKTFVNSLNNGRGAGHSVEEMIGEYVASSWKRFNYEWMEKPKQQNNNRKRKTTFNAFENMMGELKNGNNEEGKVETGNSIGSDRQVGLPLP